MTTILWIMAAIAWLSVPLSLPVVQRRVGPNLRRVFGFVGLVAVIVFFATFLFGADPFVIDSVAWFVWMGGMVAESVVTAWAARPARDVSAT